MTCQQAAELLSPYVDGELAPADRTEVDAHLAECASCLAQVESARCLKHAIARLAGSEEPPGAVRARIEALRFPRPAPSYRHRLLALTLAVVLLTFAVYAIRRQTPALPFGDELISDYLHSLPEVRPVEVASSDPREVIRFFSGKTPFAPVVPDVPSARLLGGRLCTVAGRRVELLFYSHGLSRQNFSFFVCDHSIEDTGCREYRGRLVCSRRFGKLTVLAVGEVPGHILEQILREATL
ncbi:MAG TPA: zf-HC2 domain-containing protein [Thermoanaerobaculia bacterium]|jgi:anti-sigma factor RsiW